MCHFQLPRSRVAFGMIPMYSFKHLQSFVTVAETGSFRRAAERLNRSQSAVSTQVKQLEDRLGLPLFERTTRRTVLTPEGTKLLDHMRRALTEIETGLRELRHTASGDAGEIALACVPSLAGSVLPGALKRFRAIRPNIGLRVVEQTSVALLTAVKAREVDFGIGPLVANEPGLLFQPIIEEQIVAVLPATYRREGARAISLKQLASYPVVMASNSAALRGNLDGEIAAAGIKIQSGFEVTNVHTMLAFARAGMGVALVPATTLPIPADPDLQVLPISSPPLRRHLCLISARGVALSMPSQELTQILHKSFQSDPRFKLPFNEH